MTKSLSKYRYIVAVIAHGSIKASYKHDILLEIMNQDIFVQF